MTPFLPNITYKRSTIHDQYGGNRQAGISVSANFPYIFIFSGTRGQAHGYQDKWENEDVFSYSGEGQKGNMEFTRGNLALKDHLNTGKRIFLFVETQRSYVKFEGELEIFDFDYFEALDTNGKYRTGIKFFFKRIGTVIKYKAISGTASTFADPEQNYIYNKIPNITERSGLVTSRVGQGAYRKSIIHRWKGKCAVTAFDKPEILIASHIHPWKDGKDFERLDVDNGILLSPTYDALFDRNLISFEDTGKIILSPRIDTEAYTKIGVTGKEHIFNLSDGNKQYLENHRNKLFRNEN